MMDQSRPEGELRVLVVEDEPTMNELISEILRFNGFSVASVLSGEDALVKCEAEHPDVVLLDLMLPGISGYEVCNRLKCARATNMVPVVMLTALDKRDDRVRGIRVGADDYLTKPFEPDVLVSHLRAAVEKARRLAAGGVRGRLSLSFQSDINYLAEVNDLLHGLYRHSPLSEKEIHHIRYALLEMGRNAIEWGNRGNRDLLIHIDYTLTADRLVFSIRDQGSGFNPADVPHAATPEDPLAHAPLREKLGLRDGGFGILLSKKFMDEVAWNPKGNEVTLTKKFAQPEKS